MKHNNQCPIGFGDCPDCVHYVDGECECKEEENDFDNEKEDIYKDDLYGLEKHEGKEEK